MDTIKDRDVTDYSHTTVYNVIYVDSIHNILHSIQKMLMKKSIYLYNTIYTLIIIVMSLKKKHNPKLTAYTQLMECKVGHFV